LLGRNTRAAYLPTTYQHDSICIERGGNKMANFDLVRERVGGAKAIAWDTCHKIYLLMDDEQVETMRGYGYDPLITNKESTPEEMLTTLKEWYSSSCGLRFIQAVKTNHIDPNAGFESLIGQGEDEENEVA
jgi:hypothetical protein